MLTDLGALWPAHKSRRQTATISTALHRTAQRRPQLTACTWTCCLHPHLPITTPAPHLCRVLCESHAVVGSIIQGCVRLRAVVQQVHILARHQACMCVWGGARGGGTYSSQCKSAPSYRAVSGSGPLLSRYTYLPGIRPAGVCVCLGGGAQTAGIGLVAQHQRAAAP